MFREKAQKVARAIVAGIADQTMKLMRDQRAVNLHFNPEKEIQDALQFAYDLGKKQGRAEMQAVLDEFNDTSKDPKPEN